MIQVVRKQNFQFLVTSLRQVRQRFNLVTIALGINNEESLCQGVAELKQAGHSNIKLLVSQHSFAPLGEL